MCIQVSVVYNSSIDLIISCLNSLMRQNYRCLKVTVTNNTFNFYDLSFLSLDYYKYFKNFNLINNPVPLGFSFNHNRVLRNLSSDIKYVLLLNDDTIISPDALGKLMALMDSDSRIGAVTPALYYPDGTPQRSASYFPMGLHGVLLALSGRKMPVSAHARQGTFWLRGVCLLLRVDALRAVGYLDEGFDPGYGEDIDLCYRLAKHGWSLRICQEAQVIHFESQSFGKRTVKWYRQSFRGLFRFLSRSCSPHEWRLLKACWIAGLCLRWAASFTARMIRLKTHLGPPSVYRMVLSDLLQGY